MKSAMEVVHNYCGWEPGSVGGAGVPNLGMPPCDSPTTREMEDNTRLLFPHGPSANNGIDSLRYTRLKKH